MIATVLLAAAAAPTGDIALSWPLDCDPGRTCFVQNYFDRDPGPGAKDYACGSMTYDGHDGVDIRLPSSTEMRRGVSVRAAAPGRVVGMRDGVPDISIRAPGAPSVKGRECGNGVAIEHAGGWRTQYCHMKNGSVRVRTGAVVAAGDALGEVGLSGDTEFPHLHLSVSRNGADADPFALGAPAGACRGGRSLWRADLRARLAYRSPSVIVTGFAAGPVTGAQLDEGPASISLPTARSAAIVAYVRAIGLETGDVQSLTLTAPSGTTAAENAEPALARPKAQYMLFAGAKAPAQGLAKGRWRAAYTVRRGGKVVASAAWTHLVP